ncbi:MAG TPA: hypothetical protein VMS64_35025 [Candidatus Methylomirabilis sp.]|nr:hypothetical protein [Candidatus Methylomirabilis sp.]
MSTASGLLTCATCRVLRRTESLAFAYEFRHLVSYAAWPLGFPATAACPPDRHKVCHGFAEKIGPTSDADANCDLWDRLESSPS